VKFILFTSIIVSTIINQVSGQDYQLTVSEGIKPIIDGKIESKEWAKAIKVPIHGGKFVYFQKSKDTLYIAVNGETGGFTSLSIGNEDYFRILHSSTALITASYRSENGQWDLVHNFESPKTKDGKKFPHNDIKFGLEYRKAQMDQFRWYANLVEMGSPSETEFQIPIENFKSDKIFISVVFYQAIAKVRMARFPSNLSDDCIDRELVSGSARSGLAFNPEKWVQLLLEE
jgi:hypothetical protein